MVITEVRIKLMEDNNERLQAFCSITFDDCFVIRDLKIIEGTKGSFVAMPSRKLTDRCTSCGSKNHLRSRFCNQCGGKLDENRAMRSGDGRAKLHADIAHPINSTCREYIQSAIIKAFQNPHPVHEPTEIRAGTCPRSHRRPSRWKCLRRPMPVTGHQARMQSHKSCPGAPYSSPAAFPRRARDSRECRVVDASGAPRDNKAQGK